MTLARLHLTVSLFCTLATLSASADAAPRMRVKLASQCELSVPSRTDERAACWTLKCPDRRARKLGCDLTALHQVADLRVSADDAWLAVTSVGEGHPILEIVPLAPWIAGQPLEVKCTLNPYPGTILVERWTAPEWILASDVDLTLAANTERMDTLGQDRQYALNPTACALRTLPATPAPAN